MLILSRIKPGLCRIHLCLDFALWAHTFIVTDWCKIVPDYLLYVLVFLNLGYIVPDYAWIVQDSFVLGLGARGAHVYCHGMVHDCTGFIFVMTLKV